MILAVTAHPAGRRCHLLGARIHHGLVGAVLVATGLGLLIHDWADRPWLRD